MKEVQCHGQKETSCVRNGNFQAFRENGEKNQITLNDIHVPTFLHVF